MPVTLTYFFRFKKSQQVFGKLSRPDCIMMKNKKKNMIVPMRKVQFNDMVSVSVYEFGCRDYYYCLHNYSPKNGISIYPPHNRTKTAYQHECFKEIRLATSYSAGRKSTLSIPPVPPPPSKKKTSTHSRLSLVSNNVVISEKKALHLFKRKSARLCKKALPSLPPKKRRVIINETKTFRPSPQIVEKSSKTLSGILSKIIS